MWENKNQNDLLKRAFYVKCTLRFVYYKISFVETNGNYYILKTLGYFVKTIFIKYMRERV